MGGTTACANPLTLSEIAPDLQKNKWGENGYKLLKGIQLLHDELFGSYWYLADPWPRCLLVYVDLKKLLNPIHPKGFPID